MKFVKPFLVALAVIAIAGALAYALLDKPSVPASTFTTLDGKQIDIDDLRGQVVLIDMWTFG